MIPVQPLTSPGAGVPLEVGARIESLRDEARALAERVDDLAAAAGVEPASALSRLEVFHGYIGVFGVAFLVTLLATPLMRRLALAYGVIDRPDEGRKHHRVPVAYLGGVAVFLGIIGAIVFSYVGIFTESMIGLHPSIHLGSTEPPVGAVDALGQPVVGDPIHAMVPVSVVFGLVIIAVVGLIDDVAGIDPRLKICGQLFAAAALAYDKVGVQVANGFLAPLGKLIGHEHLLFQIPLPGPLASLFGPSVPVDIVYWTGTAIIAICVLGACNASNLIDGLDGLCTGVHAIAAAGLLVVALTLALRDDGPRDAQRIILCLAVFGACLGFLPHNFNPASIFLGDCGSMLLGYCTIVVILTLGGESGFTHMVLAGLIIYAIPIVDTVLAIVRRKLEGKSIADADDQHLHHMLKRALGVKGAVFTLYGIAVGCATIGVMMSLWRARVIYAVAAVSLSFMIVAAIKAARRRAIEQQAHEGAARRPRSAKPLDPGANPPAPPEDRNAAA